MKSKFPELMVLLAISMLLLLAFARWTESKPPMFAVDLSEPGPIGDKNPDTGTFSPSIYITDGTDTAIIKHVKETGLGSRLTIGLDESNRTMVICDYGDIDVDLALASLGNPGMYIFDAAGTNYAKYSRTGVETSGYFTLSSGLFQQYSFTADIASGNAFRFQSATNVELTDTNGEQSWGSFVVKPKQSGTAAINFLKMDTSGTPTFGDGTTGDGNNLIWAGISGVSKFRVDTTGIILGAGVYGHDMNGETMRDCQVNDEGELGYNSSALRGKMNITLMEDTSWIFDLRPVNYEPKKRVKVFKEKTWTEIEEIKDDDGNVLTTIEHQRKGPVITGEGYSKESTGQKHYGLIAEEVETVNPRMVFYDVLPDGSKEIAGVHYKTLITPMLNEMTKMKQKIDELEARIMVLEKK